MHQLRRVSWKAEDVVDQYILDAALHERKQFVKKVFTGCGTLSRKGDLAKQAQDIKKTIEAILRNNEKYGIRLDYGTQAAQQIGPLDRRKRNVEEEDMVGFDQPFLEVMDMLMLEGWVENKELHVVSIIGMGGLGKTTLARKIFRSKKIKLHFDTQVWVVVSENVEAKHVLKNILQCLKVNIEKDDDDYLKEKLKDRLNGTKYMIVLDDLWTPKQWEDLKSYLPADQKRGSRILLTSRIENVAYAATTCSTTYHLKPLGNSDSWILFCKKALKGKECPPNLVDIGNGIVSKCKGLPLAIIVLGGLLSEAEAEPSTRYWSKILNDTSWHPDADNDCSKILSMSYHNLPPHLKTCFLYLGVFPEDSEIQANELCVLWVAEGFVKGRNTELEEDVAEENLIKLADRNLIMISKKRDNGSIKSVRIHDLLRDLCLKEAERCNFYEVNVDGACQNVKEGTRRLALHKSDHTTLILPPLYKGLRTLFEFDNKDSSNFRSAFMHFTVLRVVHLHVYGEYRSRSALFRLRNMVLLRYLKVYHSGWFSLSDINMMRHISKLSNLQVLNFMSDAMINLPKGIWNLKLLRHIFVRRYVTMPDAPSSDDSLPHLQTLSHVMYEKHTAKILNGGRLPSLRKLWVHATIDKSLTAVSLQSLSELLHLLALKVTLYYEPSDPLKKLVPVALPSALTKINIKHTVLTSEHWRLLGELKNLQVLKLSSWGTYTTPSEDVLFEKQPLVFETQAFPQLLHLKLGTRHGAIILEDGALRSLQYLIIRLWPTDAYPGLTALPDQLWLSTTLRQVKIISPSDDLKKYVQSLDDSKRSKVTIRTDI